MATSGAFEHGGKVVIRSVDLANGVYADHSGLLEVIRTVEKALDATFCKENFIHSEYLSTRNKKNPTYLLTKDACRAIIAAIKSQKKSLLEQRCKELFNAERTDVTPKENAVEKFIPRSLDDFGVFIKDGKPMVSSRKVAEVFEKKHFNVIQSIENLECSDSFNRLNFQAVKYKDAKGEMRPEYLMTRDGFTFLAVGFTGKRAAEFKEKYIAAFNRMEETIKHGMITGKGVYIPNFNDPIAAARAWIDAKRENKRLAEKIERDANDVQYAQAVNDSSTDISINAMSKFLSQNGFLIGQNNFFRLLITDKLVMRKDGEYWPTQYAADLKIFRIKQVTVMINGEVVLKHTLRVTVKGQKYFIKKYLGRDILPPGQLPLASSEGQ